jgi:hypothetical protein
LPDTYSECSSTFDGRHHFAPRRWGSRELNTLRTVLACVCGTECPSEKRAEVEAALNETAIEIERQRFPLKRPLGPGYGKKPRYLKRLL